MPITYSHSEIDTIPFPSGEFSPEQLAEHKDLNHFSDYNWEQLALSSQTASSISKDHHIRGIVSATSNHVERVARRTSDDGNQRKENQRDPHHSVTPCAMSSGAEQQAVSKHGAEQQIMTDKMKDDCVVEGLAASASAALVFDESYVFGCTSSNPADLIASTMNGSSSSQTPFPSRRASVAPAAFHNPFSQVPMVRKQSRSMSQPCIFFPIHAEDSTDFSLSPALIMSPQESLSTHGDSDVMLSQSLDDDDDDFSDNSSIYFPDYNILSYNQTKRRMSTPAIFSSGLALSSLQQKQQPFAPSLSTNTLAGSSAPISNIWCSNADSSSPLVQPKQLQFVHENPSSNKKGVPKAPQSAPSTKTTMFSSMFSTFEFNGTKGPSFQSHQQLTDFPEDGCSDHELPLTSRRHSTSALANVNGIYTCPWPVCGKEFTRFYNLKSHYRCHSGERPYNCEYCSASFARNHDLKRHERKHTGVKPFQCDGCKKTFSRNDAMNRHIRISNCASPVIAAKLDPLELDPIFEK